MSSTYKESITTTTDESNLKKRSIEETTSTDNTTITTSATTDNKKLKTESDDTTTVTTTDEKADINDYDEKKVIYKGKFKSWKKHSRLFATDEVVKGLLICCDSLREANSIGEMLPLLHLFANKYFPKHLQQPQTTEESTTTTTTTATESSKEGETTAESTTIESKKRFELINSGCSGIYFVSMTEDVDPIDFMNCIFVDIFKRQMIKKNLPIDFIDNEIIKNFNDSTKSMLNNADQSVFIADKVLNRICFTSKVLPILRTTRATELDLYPIAKELIDQHFKGVVGKTFSIDFRTRNNSSLEKTKVITDIAAMVDPSIKVNLSNPDIVIVIEVVKSSVVMSIIPLYKRLFKLNLREVIKCELERGPSKPKPNKKPKQQKLTKQEKFENYQKKKQLKEQQQKEKEQQEPGQEQTTSTTTTSAKEEETNK